MAKQNYRVAISLLAGVAWMGLQGSAFSKPLPAVLDGREIQFDLPAQNLGQSLRAVAATVGWELYAPADKVSGLTASPLRGQLTAKQAIERLLAGTGLEARFERGAVIVRGTSADRTGQTDAADIVVTGSRIQGTPPAAPVTVVTANDIRNAGQADLGEVARSLPMNFGGGQNPGLNFSGGGGNQNVNFNGGSTFNLRGIGPNATLTLLNGNRLSYSGPSAAIDVSAIPVAAVERIEIVADGASAIYGADAVAGVVNVLLKRDYSGVSTSARLGASTDGGNFQQQLSGVAGAKWRSGGVLGTYDFFRNTEIRASDRSYVPSSNPDTYLYPKIVRQSLLLSGHQAIGDNVTFSADLIFKAGEMHSQTGYLLSQPISYQGAFLYRPFETFGVSPTIEINLPFRWKAKVTGGYGYDSTDSTTRGYTAGRLSTTGSHYLNSFRSVEVGAQGPLFRLPAGDVRLAVGAGVRKNYFRIGSTTLNFSRRRDEYFGYAETFVPLVSPAMDMPLVRSLSVTGAVRVQDYSDSDRIATPKAGIIYSPFEALTLKASWGRSYKLPTLYQQYSGYAAVLLPVSGYGSLFPANSTFIYALGANDQDQAERSENLTLSGELKPLRNLKLTIGYFRIRYTDRVGQPFASFAGALANPLYTSFVTFNPTMAQMNAVISGATSNGGGLQNGTAGPYDPSRVIAILDNRDRNLARQIYSGFDVALDYQIALGSDRSLALNAAASRLHSRQQLLTGQPFTPLAGTIFNPARFKARGGATFATSNLSLSTFLNYVGGVIDNRRTITANLPALTTVDVTGRLKLGQRTEVAVSALNLLNTKPTTIYTASTSDTPFDATNYSAIGRFVSVTVTRSW